MTGILWQTLARKRLGTALVLCIVAAVAMLPAAALAAAPIALDAPENGNEPLVAFDPASGTMYVAWGDPEAGRSAVDLCVLPASASGCEGGAPVLLEDSHYTGDEFAGPGGLVVLPGGRVAVIGDTTEHGSIAWVSPVDGSAFLTGGQGLQNGGLPISPVSLFYAFGNAVALNGTDVGLLDDYAGFFGDTPLTTTDPAIPVANSNQTHPEGLFSRKSLETDGPEIAAEPAPAPAPVGTDIVVGVGDNFAGPTGALPGCLNKEGTGYGVSPGLVDGASNGAGTLNAEGLPGYGVLACSAQAPVLASGGQDGIGLVQEEGPGLDGAGTTITLDFRPFIATATGGSFGAPVQLADVTNQSLGGVNNLDLSDDSATGVYATWSDDQGVVLDYSSDGGATWGVPVVVPAPANGGQGHQVVVGIAGGVAEIAYDGNPGTGDQVFLQFADYHALAAAQASPPPSATPAPDTVVTSQSSGTSSSASLTIPAGTIGESDRATIAGTNAAVASGTMTYGLYSKPGCAAASLVFNGGTHAVSGGAAGASAPVTAALTPGTYYWQASYSGDANNVPNVSACGAEVLTVIPAATIEGGATSTGTTVTVTITCASTPCTVTLTITATEGGASKASVARRKKHAHAKVLTIAGGTFTILTKGPRKLTVHLTRAGKRLLAREHGHLGALVHLSEKTPGGLETVLRTVAISTVKHRHKK